MASAVENMLQSKDDSLDLAFVFEFYTGKIKDEDYEEFDEG